MTDSQGSYDQRHRHGLEALHISESDYERAIENYGATATWEVDHVHGELAEATALTERDRSLAVLAAVAALGGKGSLRRVAKQALDAGVTSTEIDELFGQVTGYCGLSRAYDGYDELAEMSEVTWPRAHERRLQPTEDPERLIQAHDVMGTIGGVRAPRTPESGLGWMVNNLGLLGRSVYYSLFGEVWTRTQMSRRDRSLVVVAIMVSQSTLAELGVHAPAGIHHGLTREEMGGIVYAIYPYIGAPRAVDGLRAVGDAIEARFGKDEG